MDTFIINVVSYRRPNNNTCNLLRDAGITNWRVFVYSFDEYLREYKQNYGEHVYVIKGMIKSNLSIKRQLVLDTSILNGYKYCFMLDDDITEMINVETNKKISIDDALFELYSELLSHPQFVSLSACFNEPKNNNIIDLYKCVCNNSIFNLDLYRKSNVKYNPESKCEDMEFTVELLQKHFVVGRLNTIMIKNTLQSGLTGDGLSYRFANTKRFIEEGSYIVNKYPHLKDAFEYDENHFKLKSDKLQEILENE